MDKDEVGGEKYIQGSRGRGWRLCVFLGGLFRRKTLRVLVTMLILGVVGFLFFGTCKCYQVVSLLVSHS